MQQVGPVAPNLHAYLGRWIQAVQQERLDRFAVFGEDHLRHLLGQYLAHYHAEPPHQAKGNAPLAGGTAVAAGNGAIRCGCGWAGYCGAATAKRVKRDHFRGGEE